MNRRDACRTEDCLDLPGFVCWCYAEATSIDRIHGFWHEPAWEDGFKAYSHVVAIDAKGLGVQCARLYWKPPRTMPDVHTFLWALRQYVGASD